MSTREPMIHELKCWPEPYQAVKSGAKTFEWRKDDRDYQIGDMLWLNEWDTRTDVYTGSPTIVRAVTYIIREGFGIPPGYCIMGLSGLEAQPSAREVVEAGNAVKSAWESLPGPAHYPPHVVADWMSNAMKPAIDQLHAALAAQPKEEARPSQTEDLEVRAREWLNSEGYMHLGLRITKRGHNGDSDMPEQVLASFARSIAPPSAPTVEQIADTVMIVWDWCDGANAGMPKHQHREYFRLNLTTDLTKLLTNP